MSKTLLTVLFVLLSLYEGVGNSAQDSQLISITEPESLPPYPLGQHIKFWHDTSPETSPGEAYIKVKNQRNSPYKIPNYSYTDATVWGLMTIENSTVQSIEMYLQLAVLGVNEAMVYRKTEGKFDPIFDHNIKTPRKYNLSRVPVFPLQMSANESIELLLKFRSSYSMMLDIWLKNKEALQEQHSRENMKFGLYLGFISFSVLAGFLLYFLTKFKTFIFYVCTISSLHLGFVGFTNGIMVPDFKFFPYLNMFPIYMCIQVSNFFGYFLFLELTNFKFFLPRLQRATLAIPAIAVIQSLMAFFWFNSLAVLASVLVAVVCMLFYIVVGSYCAIKKYEPAFYFVSGWTMIILANVIWSGISVNLFPDISYDLRYFLTVDLVLASCAFESILLVVAISAQFRIHLLEGAKAREKVSRLSESIEDARNVQSLLFCDRRFPSCLDILGYYHPAEEIGGDWYTYHYDERRNIFYAAIADVTGHGIKSALFTGAIHGAFYSAVESMKNSNLLIEDQMKNIVVDMNEAMIQSNRDNTMLATFAIMGIDLNNRDLYFISCGHCPFLHIKEESTSVFNSISNPLGFESMDEIRVKKLPLKKNEVFVLYTDGWLENSDTAEKPLTFKKFRSLFEGCKNLGELAKVFVNLRNDRFGNKDTADDYSYLAVQILDDPQEMIRTIKNRKISNSSVSKETA